jgi:hypothetical protein
MPLNVTFSQAGAPLIMEVECGDIMLAQIFIATSPAPVEEESQGAVQHESNSRPDQTSQANTETVNRETAQEEDFALNDTLNEASQADRQQQDTEMVHSGRSAITDQAVPLQSTAPPVPFLLSGQNARNHGGPLNSTLPPQEGGMSKDDDVLFFGQSSSQESEQRLDTSAADHRAEETAQEEYVEEERPKPTAQLLSEMMTQDDTLNAEQEQEGRDQEDDEDEYPPTDEEELPSTQHDTNARGSAVSMQGRLQVVGKSPELTTTCTVQPALSFLVSNTCNHCTIYSNHLIPFHINNLPYYTRATPFCSDQQKFY